MTEPSITLDEAKAIVATKTSPRITEESIKSKIAETRFIHEKQLTICIIVMENGWMSTGVSAPASAANFDPAVGERYAYDNAFKPLWQLEGYLLRQTLWEDEKGDALL